MVTVLFVDLVGFTGRAEKLDPEDVGRMLAPYYVQVRAELERFGGTVEKFIGDAVMALFGAPVVHEDDAERAVRAAFAIRRAIDELNAVDPELDLQVRIGVNTGVTLVDLDADPSRGEVVATGDVVNTAARLQQNAPVAGIVVGESTRRLTVAAVEYRELDPIAAKGKHEPVRAWEAVALRSVPEMANSVRTPLIGRAGELGLLVEAVDSAPRVVTLTGAPGIGKSRLVAELQWSLLERGERILWRRGRCLPYGAGIAYWALGEIVKAQAGILESDNAGSAARKLQAAVSGVVPKEDADWVATHLRPLVGLAAEQSGAGARSEAFSAWRSFLEALAFEAPVVVVFEDLQWADEGLLDFIEHLESWSKAPRLTVICTARPELLERRPDWPGVVRLEPLSGDETRELLGRLLRGEPFPEEVVARAAGNPLYAEEYARMLSENPDEAGLPVPESVQAIISARLDALDPSAKAVLQDAAVVGRAFWPGALAAMGEQGREELDQRLAELQRRELVRPLPRSSIADEDQYAFWHVLVRDVAYGQIPRSRRAEKHQLAAEWIASLAPDRADLAEMLAHHYVSAIEFARLSRQATEPLAERARVSQRDAGDRALALYAFAAAVRHFRGALEHWPAENPDRPRLLLRYAKALFWAEGAGEQELPDAREALLAVGDDEGAAEAEVMLSRLEFTRGERDRALDLARSAAVLVESRPPSWAKTDALGNLTAFLSITGNHERAIEVGGDAIRMAEALGLDDLRAHALTHVGFSRVTSGDLDGIEDLDESVAISARLNSPGTVQAHANLASLHASLGDLSKASRLYVDARQLAAQFGDARALYWLAAEEMYERYWKGDWDGTLVLVDSLLAEGEGYVASECRRVRACIHLARGDLEAAATDSDHALTAARRAKDPQVLFPCLALRARVLLAAGQTEAAGELARELLELWGSDQPELASFWVAELAFCLDDLGRSEELVAVGVRARPRTRWLEAAELVASGKHAEAAGAYREIGALPEEALARRRAAARSIDGGRQAEANRQLRQAAAFYRRSGADAALSECETLLGALAR